MDVSKLSRALTWTGVALAIALCGLAACGSGEIDRLRSQVSTLETRVASSNDQVRALTGKSRGLEANIRDLELRLASGNSAHAGETKKLRDEAQRLVTDRDALLERLQVERAAHAEELARLLLLLRQNRSHEAERLAAALAAENSDPSSRWAEVVATLAQVLVVAVLFGGIVGLTAPFFSLIVRAPTPLEVVIRVGEVPLVILIYYGFREIGLRLSSIFLYALPGLTGSAYPWIGAILAALVGAACCEALARLLATKTIQAYRLAVLVVGLAVFVSMDVFFSASSIGWIPSALVTPVFAMVGSGMYVMFRRSRNDEVRRFRMGTD